MNTLFERVNDERAMWLQEELTKFIKTVNSTIDEDEKLVEAYGLVGFLEAFYTIKKVKKND